MSYRISPDFIRIRNYTRRQQILIRQYFNDAVLDAFVDVFDLYYLPRIARRTGLLRARLRQYLFTQIVEQSIFLNKIIDFSAVDFVSKFNVPYAIFHWERHQGRTTYINPTTSGTYPIFAQEMIRVFRRTIDIYFRERISRTQTL